MILALNKRLGGVRYHVENAFRIMKNRFQIFHRPLECAVEDIRLAIILTCSIMVLHNFLIDVKDEMSEDLNMENDSYDRREEQVEEGVEDMNDEDLST